MSGGWPRRPLLARTARLLAVALPAVGAIAVVVALDAVVAPSVSGGVRFLVLLLAATAVVAGVSSVSRRLLPLGFLLDLDLLFPGELPSRFEVALRSGSTRALADLDDASAAETIASLAAALASHDRWTRAHSERARAYAEVIGGELRLGSHDLDRLRWAALLHDVGKLAVPRSVINKPTGLDEREWALVRRHPEAGHQLIQPLAGWLGPYAATALHHHERWDGSGYPRGLAGHDICLGARIVAVADAYEVMTSSSRVYRPTLSPTDARREVARGAGSQFDPDVVRAFLGVPLGRLRRIARVGGNITGLVTSLRLSSTTEPAGTSSAAADVPVGLGPPVGARLPDGAEAAGRSAASGTEDVDGDEAALPDR